MIRNRKELHKCLQQDFARYPSFQNQHSLKFFLDSRRKYLLTLRKLEFFEFQVHSKKKSFFYPAYLIALLRLNRMGEKIGVQIKKNTCGPGLYITHVGGIVINGEAKIGNNLTINAGVNIGNSGTPEAVPKIGDNVWIGPGAKIFGKIEIADGIAIGANAVVNKDFSEPGIAIAGVPAKKISNRGSQFQI